MRIYAAPILAALTFTAKMTLPGGVGVINWGDQASIGLYNSVNGYFLDNLYGRDNTVLASVAVNWSNVNLSYAGDASTRVNSTNLFYWFRVSWNGTNIKFERSTDGATWSTMFDLPHATTFLAGPPTHIYYGGTAISTTRNYSFSDISIA